MWRSSLPVTALMSALCAANAAENAPEVDEQVLVDRDGALAEVFPGAARHEAATVTLSVEERKQIEEKLGRKLAEQQFTLIRALDDKNAVLGYAVVTDEIGKFQPITFLVAITPKAVIQEIIVMVYRESHGGEVKRRRFLQQFGGKGVDDAIKVSKDIINISGATLSAHAIARGAKKVLWLAQPSILNAERQGRLSWQPLPKSEGKKSASSAEPGDRWPSFRRARHRMGTVLEVVLFARPGVAAEAAGALYAEVARLERLLSIYLPESDISRVNREGQVSCDGQVSRDGKARPVAVAPETVACVESALHWAAVTGGSFDPTCKPEGFRQVEVDRRLRTIRFNAPGLALDLGAIGKGYALDRAARLLRARGVNSALLNFGGQVLALDPPERASHWIIGVRDPENESTVAGYFACANVSISTSGLYERGAHIVNPLASGGAGMNALEMRKQCSASVLHPSATAADALSTALLVQGRDALRAIAAQSGAVALLIDEEGQWLAGNSTCGSNYRYQRLPRLPAHAPV